MSEAVEKRSISVLEKERTLRNTRPRRSRPKEAATRAARRQVTMVDAMLRSVTPSICAPEIRIYWVCMALVSMPRAAYSFFTYTTALWVTRLSGAPSRLS